MTTIIALVKPVPLEVPRTSKEGLVTEGIAWGLAEGERAALAFAMQAAHALDAKVEALALAPQAAGAGLREALALGAHRATRIEPGSEPLDAATTAKTLAKAVQRFPKPWLIVAADASADGEQGLVGAMVAELLGLDLLSGATRAESAQGGLVVAATRGAEVQRWRVKAPALVTVSASGSRPAHPTSWGVGQAYEHPLETLQLKELGLAPQAPLVQVASVRRAEARRGEAEVHEGDPDEAAGQLFRRLRAGGWVK